MKLITWNCQGAFRKKINIIMAELPDILVIQECEHPDKLESNTATPSPTSNLWFGDNNNKGLGIFSYSSYKFQVLENYNTNFKTIVPLSVTGGQLDFMIFAIWANNPQELRSRYIEQVWKAINYYNKILETKPIILIGDFNSNKIWDKKSRLGNHSDVVDFLHMKNIHSIYHKHLNQCHGKENDPTFFLQRNKNKPYHIDYCFVSIDLYSKFKELEIGNYEKWIVHSDHLPLMINFDI